MGVNNTNHFIADTDGLPIELIQAVQNYMPRDKILGAARTQDHRVIMLAFESKVETKYVYGGIYVEWYPHQLSKEQVESVPDVQGYPEYFTKEETLCFLNHEYFVNIRKSED